MVTLTTLREQLAQLATDGKTFEAAIEVLIPQINQLAEGCREYKAENWQMAIDTLAYVWWAKEIGGEKPSVETVDQISLTHSPFRAKTEAIIAKEKREADEWAAELKEAGMSPFEALGGAMQVCERVVQVDQLEQSLAMHPSPIVVPQAIVQMYRVFYRASARYRIKTADAIRPLQVAIDVITRSSSNGEALAQEVAGAIAAKMRKIRAGTAQGRWVLSDTQLELTAISAFSNFMVYNVLGQRFNGDKSQFSSKISGIGLIADACVCLYQLEQDKENG
jgi:hypothetical protein